MANTKPIVHLRVYKSNGFGTQISKSEDGKIQNENHLVKVIYNTIEWNNYLKYIGIHGFIKVSVEKVIENGEDAKDLTGYQKEIDKALNPESQKELTPEQKRIADLEAKLESLLSGKKESVKTEPADFDNDLAKAREEYVKVFGKKGHHSWSVEQINEKIAEEQNK